MNLSFFKNNGTAKLPKAIFLFPTLRCNMRCVMCDVPLTDSGVDKELTPEDHERLLRNLNTWWKKPYFYIGGGEPLVYKYFSELIELLNKNKYEVLLNTNGILLSKFAEKIMDNNIKTLIVSIDGKEMTHNKIRCNKNSFSSLMSGIKEINKLKEERNSVYPRIVISNVIVPENYKELYEILEEINKLHIHSITIHTFKFIDPAQREAQKRFIGKEFGKDHYYFPVLRVCKADEIDVDIDTLAEQIQKIERDRHKFNFNISYSRHFKPQTVIDYHTGKYLTYLGRMSCYNLYNSINIGPCGEIHMCLYYYLGNVKENSIKEVWNSDKARLLRKKFQENHGFPACWRCGGFSEK